MRTKEQLISDLTDAEENLHEDIHSTGTSFRLRNIISTYFGDNHNFMQSYTGTRSETGISRLIGAIRHEIDTHDYDWWNYHNKPLQPSFIEKVFDANPKSYKYLLENTQYILTFGSAIIGAIFLNFLKANKWVGLSFITLFGIGIVAIIVSLVRSVKK